MINQNTFPAIHGMSAHDALEASMKKTGKRKWVLLESDTIGISDNPRADVGDYVTVTLDDENGALITEHGKIIEVLDD